MPVHYLCACKEINGSIYIARMSVPSTISPTGSPVLGLQSGSDDGVWYFVGPGSRPSCQHYNGLTQFILTFDFLGHLECRVVDIGSWPPSVVNPIGNASSGGPNTNDAWQANHLYVTGSIIRDPAGHVQQAGGAGAPGGNGGTSGAIQPIFNDVGGTTLDGAGASQIRWVDRGPTATLTTQFAFINDASALNLVSSTGQSLVDNFFNAPLLDRSLLFFDAGTNTYSVTLTLDPGWLPFLKPTGVTPYFRLYNRLVGTLPWVLIMDWTPNTFAFTDFHVGSLRYEYTATWGDLYDPTDPFNPAKHAEGVPGFGTAAPFPALSGYTLRVDSTTEHAAAQVTVNEPLFLDFDSTMAYGAVGTRQAFITEAPSDVIGFPVSSVGTYGDHPSNAMAYGTAGDRQAFINDSAADTVLAPFGAGASNYSGSMASPTQMY